ncbi:hypothetical protein [Nitratifractor sp.]
MKKTLIVSALLTLALIGGVPSYQQLCDAIKTPPGWQAEKCEGMKINNPMMGEVVSATQVFRHDGKKFEVVIASGMQAMDAWSPFMNGVEMESDEGLLKIKKISTVSMSGSPMKSK